MRNSQISDMFKPFILPFEAEGEFGQADSTQALILILRKLASPKCEILYRYTPEGGYDSSDLCMEETTVFAYRRSDEYDKGYYREIGRVIEDRAANIITLEDGQWVFSFGSIIGVSFDSPMGVIGSSSAWESCKLLLRNAAATNIRQRLTFPRTEADTYIVRLWNDWERTHQDLARVVVANWPGRYDEHFAIELL